MVMLFSMPQLGLRADEEMMRHALEQSPDYLVGLKVSLLSGRCCSEIFRVWPRSQRSS